MIPFQPRKLVMALAAVLSSVASVSALAQQATPPASTSATPATTAPAAQPKPAATNVRDLSETRVTAKRLDAARNALSPDTGSSVYKFDTDDIARLPLGDATPLNQVLLRNRSIVGVDWGAWSMRHPAEQRALLDELLAMVADERLDPVSPRTEPLTSAPQVLDDLLNRRVVGKVALLP